LQRFEAWCFRSCGGLADGLWWLGGTNIQHPGLELGDKVAFQKKRNLRLVSQKWFEYVWISRTGRTGPNLGPFCNVLLSPPMRCWTVSHFMLSDSVWQPHKSYRFDALEKSSHALHFQMVC
jgi:hypothetical protein